MEFRLQAEGVALKTFCLKADLHALSLIVLHGPIR